MFLFGSAHDVLPKKASIMVGLLQARYSLGTSVCKTPSQANTLVLSLSGHLPYPSLDELF